jgi:hypothetical protein
MVGMRVYSVYLETTALSVIVAIMFVALGSCRGGADRLTVTLKEAVPPVGHPDHYRSKRHSRQREQIK